MPGTYKDLLSALALSESSNRYNYVNSLGYAGAYQFGEAALRMIGYYKLDGTNGRPYDWKGGWTSKDGIDSLNEWLANPAVQDKAVGEWFKYLWTTEIKSLGLQQYVGHTINGVKVTESGILAGSHLVGAAAVATYLKSGGSTGVSDPSGTTAASYIAKFAGYAVDPISVSTPTSTLTPASTPLSTNDPIFTTNQGSRHIQRFEDALVFGTHAANASFEVPDSDDLTVLLSGDPTVRLTIDAASDLEAIKYPPVTREVGDFLL